MRTNEVFIAIAKKKYSFMKGNDITAGYDFLGRKLSLSSVACGEKRFFYDAYRLISEDDAVLRSKDVKIFYEYDGFNRLSKIDYPETAATVYTYGDSGTADNAAGKVTQVTDASGTIRYRYGKLGEVTEETRTLSVKSGKQGETMTATTGYLSNYLGQMERISYPDGETVEYGYDAGGQGGGNSGPDGGSPAAAAAMTAGGSATTTGAGRATTCTTWRSLSTMTAA